ncbi:histidine acid phosphatase [Teladorsagia circumcincta]|uniref:Histidine acid phosphatase n=1 Tax=Teladorsagia circumcincta TaxID=45464 RepID=A0A2G9UUM2_TELCI|nr:histidine acid phosphatase [Teladorsagia circumcincta]
MSGKHTRCRFAYGIYLLACISSVIGDEPYIPTAPPIPVAARPMKPNDKLHLVQVVWRHGDRAPVMTYPTDVHQEEAWPNGWGELTELGMRQQYALGNVLRRRYMTGTEPFLNSRYNSKQVYVRSTDVNRTLISAYSNIAGMFSGGEAGKDFPNETKYVYNAHVLNWPSGWTPVPVHTLPTDEDHDFLEYLSKYTGMKVDLPIVYLINDVHHIETIYNMSQPKWMTHEVSKRLRNLTSLVNEYAYGIGEPYVPELIRLRGGPMLRSIVDLMNLKKDCLDSSKQRSECNWIKPLKYYAYSAVGSEFYDPETVKTGGWTQG